MHVIAKRMLREFWAVPPRALPPLEEWFQLAERAGWSSFDDVRASVGRRADRVGRLVVFDVGGNKYRVIVAIHYNRGKLFVRRVLTHAEYTRGTWKDE